MNLNHLSQICNILPIIVKGDGKMNERKTLKSTFNKAAKGQNTTFFNIFEVFF